MQFKLTCDLRRCLAAVAPARAGPGGCSSPAQPQRAASLAALSHAATAIAPGSGTSSRTSRGTYEERPAEAAICARIRAQTRQWTRARRLRLLHSEAHTHTLRDSCSHAQRLVLTRSETRTHTRALCTLPIEGVFADSDPHSDPKPDPALTCSRAHARHETRLRALAPASAPEPPFGRRRLSEKMLNTQCAGPHVLVRDCARILARA
eukprot:5458300-Pleurochrysis_carterae.AAC.5